MQSRFNILRNVIILLASATPALAQVETTSYERSPVDAVITSDEKFLLTANQTSNSISLVSLSTHRVVDELKVGNHPTDITLLGNTKRGLVVCQHSGELTAFEISGGTLRKVKTVFVGMSPSHVAVNQDGTVAYVSQSASASVAVVDLNISKVIRSIQVGKWPRQIALSDGIHRLAVACNGDRRIHVIDTESYEVAFEEPFGGINTGQMKISQDGKYVNFPWMVYRQNPITDVNIRRGWVLGSRIGRVRLDQSTTREAFTLDVPGKAVSDPHGIAMTSDEKWLVCTGSGTHELLVYRTVALKYESVGGPGDHINPRLANDNAAFYRIPLKGRPLNICMGKDNRTVYVVNYLDDSIQVVDLEKRKLIRTIPVGVADLQPTLARLGETLFYDGTRSLDQWYSCHSCHWEGGPNAVTMDTMNDGSFDTYKTVPSLRNVAHTAPWTWHGWQKDLGASIRKSFTETMRGKTPNEKEQQAMIVYLSGLRNPENPYLQANSGDEKYMAAVDRGRKIFQGSQAGCANCHSGPYFTDGEIHDVGQGSSKDKYDGYNTPSLIGVHQRTRLLHHGRAKDLKHLLTRYHKPHELGDGPEISTGQLEDLITYLSGL